MRASPLHLTAATLLVTVGMLYAAPVSSQSLWLSHSNDYDILLEANKLNFKSVEETFATSAFFLGTRLALSENVASVVELPFAHFGVDQSSGDASSTAMGNPYLGIEAHGSNSDIFGELGVRLPLAPDDEGSALATGLLSDVNRWEAFLPNVLSVQAAFNYLDASESEDGIASVRLRAGATLWIPTEDAGEAELFALFGILIRQEAKYYRVGGGLGGRVLITEDLKYNDRIVSQFEAAADFGAGKVRPGLLLRWPLESVVRGVITDPIFGLKLDVRL